MWFIHNCVPWGSSCQPSSWADLGELLAALAIGVNAIIFGWLGLWALGEWLDGLF